ncbi:hypothetical protein M0D69_21950 [Caballeronia sp. SEWSISQ10-4 2]|uniref:hypothetical protein n=1 Tax=Caballeronia sp. SEWSISQ10-4 2 TaxID=2937438 RepID=UPI0026570E80|nr:hypothetical protein [Caballeronia sp. SEWSISQ10-4 2]MDN7180609.1 hypothetical protein [Caballeronia sp. SEWSISQ10-4 2]
MLTQTFETILALCSFCFLRLSALTSVGIVQGFGAVLGIFVGVVIPLGLAMTTRRQSDRL